MVGHHQPQRFVVGAMGRNLTECESLSELLVNPKIAVKNFDALIL